MKDVHFVLYLENLRDQINFEWMENVHDILYGSKWIIFHELLAIDYFIIGF